MSSPAQSRGARKGLRDAFQAILAVIAGGSATVAIEVLLGSVNHVVVGAILTIVFKVMIAYAQNYLETAGKIPILLPTPGIVPSVGAGAAVAVGTVDAVAEKVGNVVGEVTGTVQSVTGELMGVVRDVDHEEE